MNKSSLETAIHEAQSKNDALKASALTEFPERAKSVRVAAESVGQALVELQTVPVVLVKYYIALQQANEQVVAALNPDGQLYTDEDMTRVKGVLDRFQVAAERFKEIEMVFNGTWKAEPLLPTTGRNMVGVAAIGLLVLGAIAAALGTAKGWSASTTLSNWFAFASFALAVVWVFAYFAVRRPSVPTVGSPQKGSSLQYQVFGGMAFLVLGLLFAGVLKGDLLEFLSSVSGARGLITFLIAIGTIAIAVILTLASVITEANDTDELKERLSKGKEILTVLVGVLGTIVGFYFASNHEGSVGSKITVSIVDEPKTVEAGASFSVLAMTTGGEIPYDSTPIIITVKEGIDGKGTVNEQGVIKVDFKVAENVDPGSMPFEVGLRDKSGKMATAKSAIDVVAEKSTEKK